MYIWWRRCAGAGTVFGIITCGLLSASSLAGEVHGNRLAMGDQTTGTTAKQEAAEKARDSFSGNISWYGPGLEGHKTASGELFNMEKLTAAHRKLPFYTKLLVENPKNGQSCIVKVNDRGPFVPTRVLDVTKGAAGRLGSLGHGVFYGECLVLED